MDESLEFQQNRIQGQSEFERARRQGFFNALMAIFRGKPAELLSFDEVRARLRLHGEHYQGVRDVPLDKIVGSVGRYHEFTRAFLPKQRVDGHRWSRVYAAAMSMEGVPPIEVYQVGGVYFVRDGNHRVSVARRLGATHIDAEVITLTTPIGLRPDMTDSDLDEAALYVDFLKRTGLDSLGPDMIPLHLSEPSRCDELFGQIKLHYEVQRAALDQALALETAAKDWYTNVYAPVIDPVCTYNVLEHFPNRTKADLFLWAMDHLCAIKQDCSATLEPQPLKATLGEFLRAHNIPVPAAAFESGAEDTAAENTD